VNDGAWHQAALTVDGAGVQTLFLDGAQVGSSSGVVNWLDMKTGQIAAAFTTNWAATPGGWWYFNGTLADVAIYHTALPAARALAHHNAVLLTSTSTTGPVIYNTSYPVAVNGDAPVSYWRLGDAVGSSTASDSNGSNPGTYSAGVTLGQAGPVPGDASTAAAFNGTSGTITIPDAANLRFDRTQPFSVEAWFKTTSTGNQVIAGKMANSSPFQGWELGVNGGKPYVWLINSYPNSALGQAGSKYVADGAWHHIVATYDGTSKAAGVHFFIDGTPDNGAAAFSDNLSGPTVSTVAMAIGSRASSAFWFNGKLSDVAVYGGALAPAQGAAHYQASLSPYPAAVNTDGASGYWRLPETGGTTAADYAGSNPGTYGGTVTLGQPGPLTGDPSTAPTFGGGYVALPTGFSWLASGFTMEAWIKPTAASVYARVLEFGTGAASNNVALSFGPSGKDLELGVWNGGASTGAVNAPNAVTLNAWQHVAASFAPNGSGGGSVNIYLNGSPIKSGTINGLPNAVAYTQNAIGKSNWSDPLYQGAMSDVAVYAAALSDAQVAAHRNAGLTAPAAAKTTHTIDIEDQQFVAGGHLTVSSTPGGASFDPNYGLLTQTTDPDSKVTQTQFSDGAHGIDPKFGLPTATIQDPAGLALTTSTTYETPGTGTFLRRTAKTLPAGNQTTYTNYGGTDGPLAAVCGVTSTTPQGGQPEQATDPTNATGSARVEQYVYDAIGRKVGTRVGSTSTISSAGWGCTTYDGAGRLTSQSWPAFGSQAARTVTYTYALGGNPLANQVTDTNWPGQSISSTVDLLGRTVSYTDIWGNTTSTTYDQAGRVTDTNGPVGANHIDYDQAGRVQDQQLGGQTLASPAYSPTTGLLTGVGYPSATGNSGNGTTATIGYDGNMRENALTFNQASSALMTSDQTTLSQAGRVSSETIDGGSTSSFTYDGAGRLGTASVPANSLMYNYAPTGGCGALGAAGNNTDRTSLIDNGSTTTYCYDGADRLTSSSDARYAGTIAYDDHGNTTTLGNQALGYDSADRHMSTMTSGSQASSVTYLRDPLDRIVERDSTLGLRGTGTATTGALAASSVAVPKPVGTQTGDLLLAQIAWTAAAGIPSLTAPTGWTLVNNTANTSSTESIYWHVAGASEPATYNFTFSAPTEATGAIVGYTGADPNTPIDASAAATDTNTTSHVAPAVTTTGANETLLVTISAAPSTVVTPATGMAERWQQATSAPVGNVTSEGADQIVAAAGSTGTRTLATAQAASSVLHTIAVRPGPTSHVRYGYTDHSDNTAMELNSSNQVLDRTLSLVGGVNLTRTQTTPSAADVWSYPNIHGDVAATSDGTGTKTGNTFTWDPFGQPLTGQPTNTASSLSYGWEGSHLKGTEHQGDIDTIEMGERPYLPGAGRFLSVDPVEAGCANQYSYGFGDPVNGSDLTGQKSWWSKALCVVTKNPLTTAGIIVSIVAIPLTGGSSLALAAGLTGLGLSAAGAVLACRGNNSRSAECLYAMAGLSVSSVGMTSAALPDGLASPALVKSLNAGIAGAGAAAGVGGALKKKKKDC
jgi:RHS repeat-associated protein